jgi:hypothetical protein
VKDQPDTPRLFLIIGGEIRGPFQPEQLRQLVEGGAITPATDASYAATGPWRVLSGHPESANLFPQRSEIHFKPAEFETVNRATVPPVDHRELIAWANLPPPPSAFLRQDSAAPAIPKPEPVNEVLEIVREVARVDARYEKPMVFPSRRQQYRHLIHYLILAAIGTGAVASIGFFYRPIDSGSVLILGSWAVLYNGGLAIIMRTLRAQR